MAPSRAFLVRRIASSVAQPQLRSATRLLPKPFYKGPCQRIFSALQHARPRHTNLPTSCRRPYSQEASTGPEAPDYLNEAELHIFNKIKGELEPVNLEVQDISGGCGSMYAINIESPKFKGLTVIKQHKLVNQVLKEEIAKWHGVQLRTKAP